VEAPALKEQSKIKMDSGFRRNDEQTEITSFAVESRWMTNIGAKGEWKLC
jgi:hypothetical protein